MPALRERLEQAAAKLLGQEELVTRERFNRLRAQARARAFTVARLQDMAVMRDMRDAVVKAIDGGESFADFRASIERIMAERGWTGTDPWHQEIIYKTNVDTAYSAGRWDQAREAGIRYWRYLPSIADNPREEHKQFYDQVYPLGEGPMPPLDFGCKCSWESVLPDEEEEIEVERTAGPPVPAGQEFQFRPADYFQPVRVDLAQWPPELHAKIRQLALEDPRVEIALG